jgi:hypothetical protein
MMLLEIMVTQRADRSLHVLVAGKGKDVPVLNEFKHYAMKSYEGVDV